MSEVELQKQIEKEIRNTFNLDVLGLDVWPMANHVRIHPDESPLTLVYESENGKFESDKKIRKDLSNLVGFEIKYRKDGCDHEITAIILFSTINEKDLHSVKNHRTITLGEIRKFAETIHPFAKIVDKKIATTMWQCASDFYTMKYMLGKRNFEFPGIMCLSSCEQSDSDEEYVMNHNFTRGMWNYTANNYERIFAWAPVWCYIETE